MTTAQSSAVLPAPSFEALLETLDNPHRCSNTGGDEAACGDPVLIYRASPDGSVTMGTDPLSGQVVLIVQNTQQKWEIALPPKIAKFASTQTVFSLAAAQRLAEQAFTDYWAKATENRI